MFNFLVLAVLVTALSHIADGGLSDILKTCPDDIDCHIEDETRSPEATYKFMSGGVPQILWDEIRTWKLSADKGLVSSQCRSSLLSIVSGMNAGNSWSYRFLDSSGKTPPGLLRATMTSLGDYDECLDIETGDDSFGSQYCMIDLYPLRTSESYGSRNLNTSFSISRTSVFRGFPFPVGLCWPTTCTRSDIKTFTQHILKPLKIKVDGDMNCDTKTSISLQTKLMALTTHQVVSMAFVLTLIGMVGLATLINVYNRLVIASPLPKLPEPEILTSMSIVDTTRRTFYAKPWTHEVFVFDAMKLGVILSGTMGHILVCAEMPISYFMMDRHEVLNYIFSSAETQPLLNDAGLLGVTFLSGVATFMVTFPMAKANKLPYVAAIFDRFVRFLPAMVTLTALEFLWPLFGSGPLFTRIADFNLMRCTKNWVLNLLFVNNHFIKSIDICGGSSFYSSVDMQLFIIGLIVVWIYSKSVKMGYKVSALIISLSMLKTMYNAFVYKTTGTLFASDPIPIKISEYFDYIHMSIFSYLPAYLVGFVAANHIKDGRMIPKLATWREHLVWIIASQILMGGVNMSTMAYNHFKIVPESLTFIVITVNRVCQLGANVLLFLYLLGLKPKPSPITDGSATSTNPPTETLSIFKALCRLSFPLYVSNYLYIRLDFFTRRSLLTTHPFLMVKRLISTTVIIYLVAYVVQILFLGPLEGIRRCLLDKKKLQTSKTDQEFNPKKGA